ncbi:MAG: secretin N-terminal domain-containing protein [Gammaproteobacteria bacterium]|nr:secretin N-terminal domain-containing protein [Gammaproteobacteria bacterium]
MGHRWRFTTGVITPAIMLLLLLPGSPRYACGEQGQAEVPAGPDSDNSIMKDGKISLTLRDMPIAEVMEMLSRAARVNVLLSDNVEGKVSVNLYDVSIDQAIDAIVASAGFSVEERMGSYFIVERDEAGKHSAGGPTRLRTFKVQYSDPDVIAEILESHLSGYGQVTTLPERRMLVVEDTPHFLNRISKLLQQLDRQPRQILIEAQILEVGLKDSESYGLDWAALLNSGGRNIDFGTKGLSNPGSPGLFLDYFSSDLTLVLDALRTRERLRTLSTPKLLALEDQEAETIIGDRLGYNVTTTIDNVTTTSTEFLESGVILRVKPAVDEQGRVLLEIHPEVSTGSVSDDGIPNQKTTEVTTTMLVESGKTVFIGGLIKRTASETREGIPVLGDIPGLGLLFSNKGIKSINTELVVLITPHILDNGRIAIDSGKGAMVNEVSDDLDERPIKIEKTMSKMKRFEDMRVPGFGDKSAVETTVVEAEVSAAESEELLFFAGKPPAAGNPVENDAGAAVENDSWFYE